MATKEDRIASARQWADDKARTMALEFLRLGVPLLDEKPHGKNVFWSQSSMSKRFQLRVLCDRDVAEGSLAGFDFRAMFMFTARNDLGQFSDRLLTITCISSFDSEGQDRRRTVVSIGFGNEKIYELVGQVFGSVRGQIDADDAMVTQLIAGVVRIVEEALAE